MRLQSIRRTGAVLVLVAAIAAQAGCSGLSGGGSNDAAGPAGATTLNLLMVEQDSTKELRTTLIPQFEKSSGIKVNVELLPESGYDAKLATAVDASTGQYDVVMTGAKHWNTLVSRKAIVPLDDLTTGSGTEQGYLDGFPRTLLDNLKLDGKTYAMPYQVGAELLFYNKDLFSKAGLDPQTPPTTLAEVVTAAQTIKAKTGKAGFVGRGSREGNENSFLWLMMWFLNGGRWPDGADPAGFSVLTQPPALTATTNYLDLLGKYGPKGVSNYGFAEAQLAMQQGEAGMWLDAAQLGPALEDPAKSKIAGKVGYAALKGQGGEDYIVGAVWGFSVATATKHQEQAWKLVQFLTGAKTGIAQVESGTNGSSGRSDVLADPAAQKALNPGFVTALTEAVAHTNPRYTPLIPQGQQIRGALALELSNSLSKGRSADATMKATQSQVQGLLK